MAAEQLSEQLFEELADYFLSLDGEGTGASAVLIHSMLRSRKEPLDAVSERASSYFLWQRERASVWFPLRDPPCTSMYTWRSASCKIRTFYTDMYGVAYTYTHISTAGVGRRRPHLGQARQDTLLRVHVGGLAAPL